jgi:chemotaxis protein CheX
MASWLSQIRRHTRYLNIPLVAVSGCTCKEARARLYAAGASAVCPADADNGRILEEVRQRCDMQPVLTEIRTKLLEPFTYATYVTLREMAGTAVAVESIYRKTDYRMFGDVSAVIGLLARTEGFMVLSLPDATAAGLVRRILAGITDDPDADMVRDGVGEIANVIAGQAKGLLAGTPYQFDLSTPTVVSGAGHEIRHKPGTPCLVIAFTSDLGDFAMQLCLKV